MGVIIQWIYIRGYISGGICPGVYVIEPLCGTVSKDIQVHIENIPHPYIS